MQVLLGLLIFGVMAKVMITVYVFVSRQLRKWLSRWMSQHWQWKRYGFPLSFFLSSCGAFEPVVINVAPAPCFFLSLKSLIWSRDVVVLLDFVSA